MLQKKSQTLGLGFWILAHWLIDKYILTHQINYLTWNNNDIFRLIPC